MLLQLLLLALLSASVLAVRQSHILVVLNTDAEREAYSQFFQDVQHRGFQLTYTTPNSAPVLVEKEQRYYDHLFLWADQTKRFPDTLNAKALVQFVERGGNILFTAGPQMSENMRTFATQFGVFFEERDTQVIDHFGYDAQLDQGKHTVLTAKQLDDAPRTLRADTTAPILYEGIGHISSRNPMLMRVLSASQTAYSAEPVEERVVDEEPMATGHELGLVSAFQAVNNARVVLSGSRVMFSNRFITSPVKTVQGQTFKQSGNEQFVRRLSQWVLQEVGVLRAHDIQHTPVQASSNATGYRIKDHMTFSIAISERDGAVWKPYEADDVQLETVMLDPYIRVNLPHVRSDKTSAWYEKTIQLPDVFGVYTFRVRYQRPGYSWIHYAEQVPIRPFRHDEYPRFLTIAYPYYTGAGSVMIAFVVFVVVWLYHHDVHNK